jgi:hypothetical protein
MARIGFFLLCITAATQFAGAEFVPALLANRSYWGDGKSEIDFYQAEFMRDGETHQCEVTLIFTPMFVEPNTMARVEEAKRPPAAIPAIQMLEMATVPRGLAPELRSIEALWRMDSMSLARLVFAGSDSTGTFSKAVREKREGSSVSWSYVSDTYGGRTDPQPIAIGSKQIVACDELPLRVRALDFSKAAGDFEVDLAPTLASPAKEFGDIKPAKISWKRGERTIQIDVQDAGGKDALEVDANFPFLLREWRRADGTHWKMKNSIRADYRKYLKNGDRERALKDPMLRHPD